VCDVHYICNRVIYHGSEKELTCVRSRRGLNRNAVIRFLGFLFSISGLLLSSDFNLILKHPKRLLSLNDVKHCEATNKMAYQD
jgi:hypothetical protein